jgi:hypothetical protein
VAEFYQSKTKMPVNNTDAGCPTSPTANAKTPIINNGAIEVPADGGLRVQLIAGGSGTSFIFTPLCGDPATPVCTGAALAAWDCRLATTIKAKYLPPDCR